MSVEDLSVKELQHVVWEQLGIRPSPRATAAQLHSILRYEIHERDLPKNRINELRNTLMSFIKAHEGQLSLPCSGDCYEHTDARVISCYIELEEDLDDNKKKE